MTTQYKPRLQRLHHVFDRTPLYFITFCTHERRQLLANEPAHQAFRAFGLAAAIRGACIGRYVLMPDHAHFFVMIGTGGPLLSDWIKSFKNSLSKTFRATGEASPHWQKGFFDHVMRSAESYAQKWEYVRANPVRATLPLRRTNGLMLA